MSNKSQEKTSVTTPVFRVSYPNVFKSKINDLNGKMEFSVQALFEKGEKLEALKKAAHAACVENWGPDQAKWPTLHNNPFRDQSERAKDGVLPDGYTPGAIFMNLKSTERPGVVDQNVEKIIDETKFYAGCYAIASVNAYAYPNTKNPKAKAMKPGVAFGLNHLQFVKDGDPFSGRPKVEDSFKQIEQTTNDSAKDGTDIFG